MASALASSDSDSDSVGVATVPTSLTSASSVEPSGRVTVARAPTSTSASSDGSRSTVTTRRVLVASYSGVGVPGISVTPTSAWAAPTRIDSGSTRNSRRRHHAGLVQAVVLLELLDRVLGVAGELVVDGAGVVAEPLQVALELADVGAVVDAVRQLAVERQPPGEQHHRLLVDAVGHVAGPQGAALGRKPGEYAVGLVGRHLLRLVVAEVARDAFGVGEGPPLDLDHLGRRQVPRRWPRRCLRPTARTPQRHLRPGPPVSRARPGAASPVLPRPARHLVLAGRLGLLERRVVGLAFIRNSPPSPSKSGSGMS